MSAPQRVKQIPCLLVWLIVITLSADVIIALVAFYSSSWWAIPILLFLLNLGITMFILAHIAVFSVKSDYFVSCYDQLLLFYTLFAIITSMIFIYFSLYGFLHGLSNEELLRFYFTLLPVIITSLSIMFAVSFWVVNRVEGIAEDIRDDRLARTTQIIKGIIVFGYTYTIFFIFLPLLGIFTPLGTSTPILRLALVLINLSLSCPLGLAAGIIQTLIVLDMVAVTLRRRLRRQRQ